MGHKQTFSNQLSPGSEDICKCVYKNVTGKHMFGTFYSSGTLIPDFRDLALGNKYLF